MARKNKGLSQEELAAIIQTDQKQISIYEGGKGNPTAEYLILMATALGVSSDWLLGLSDDPIRAPRYSDDDLLGKEREAITAWRKGNPIEAVKIIANDC